MRFPPSLPAASAVTAAVVATLIAGLSAASPALAADPGSVEVVKECVQRNIPKESSVQLVELTAVDRVDSKEVSRAKIKGKRFAADGLRRILMRFTKPIDMRGSALLAIEHDERSADMFVYTPELRKVKRVTGGGACSNLFGTDIDCEVFAQWQGLNRPGDTKRLPDAKIEGRAVYVTDTFSPPEDSNRYEKVRAFVDQQTCVTLRSEFYEDQTGTPRKLLLADLASVIEEQGIWLPMMLRVEDLLDETFTEIAVEDIEIDVPLQEREFSTSELGKKRR